MSKKPTFYKFWKKGNQKKEIYYGDIWNEYEGFVDKMTPDAKFTVFGGMMNSNYIFLTYSDYEAFAKRVGLIMLQASNDRKLAQIQNSPIFQKMMQQQQEDMMPQIGTPEKKGKKHDYIG